MPTEICPSHANDFDFFIGSWRVLHRRLKDRLVGSREWVEFEGTTTVQKILGDMGNMDDNTLDLPEGPYRAISLRTYDPETDQWAIWWLDGRHPLRLDVPVVGRFRDGVGTFLAEDTWQGVPIRVRFQWTVAEADKPRWEQAFSTDGGQSWETNWVMEFTRHP